MSLVDTQRTLAKWIRAPEGVANALSSERHPEASKASLETLVKSDATLDATSRLEIYANAYFYRVLGVLAEDYEALHGLLGEGLFNDLVTSYLLVEPSRHPSLRYAGERMPRFLSEHPASEGLRARAPWAADLARFEWARVDAFDAENAPILERATLAAIAPEAFERLPMRLDASVHIERFNHCVDDLWRAGRRNEEGPRDQARNAGHLIEPIDLLVWRRDERVRHRRLTQIEASALGTLVGGSRFGSLCEWTASRVGEADAPARAAAWLEQWIVDGILSGAEPRS